MAVYKLFAEKDATIYSDQKLMNTGLDSILELNKKPSILYATQSTAARFLIKFSDTEIGNILSTYASGSNYSVFLKLYKANAESLPANYTIEAFPLFEQWDMGTGRYANSPETRDGVCWTFRDSNQTNVWLTSGYPLGVTGSYKIDNPGGGSWYYNYISSQSFGFYTNKDIELDVTSFINDLESGSVVNNGFIVKNIDSIEFDPNYQFLLNFFSRDTNTIYPPVLEIRWDDFYYSTGSLEEVTNTDIYVTMNNSGLYSEDSIQRFRMYVRDKFPVRHFTTSSLYNVQKYLPENSVYKVVDYKTKEDVISFDDTYTKISADENGNFFDLYMNGLEPDRFYKIVIKSIIKGSTLIIDNNFIFKIP